MISLRYILIAINGRTSEESLPVSSSLLHPTNDIVRDPSAAAPFIRIQTLHTFFKCWKRSKKEPSLENTFAGLALWTLGFELAVVEGDEAEGAGEAYPLVLACGTGVPLEDLCDMSYVEVLKLRMSRRVSSRGRWRSGRKVRELWPTIPTPFQRSALITSFDGTSISFLQIQDL